MAGMVADRRSLLASELWRFDGREHLGPARRLWKRCEVEKSKNDFSTSLGKRCAFSHFSHSFDGWRVQIKRNLFTNSERKTSEGDIVVSDLCRLTVVFSRCR